MRRRSDDMPPRTGRLGEALIDGSRTHPPRFGRDDPGPAVQSGARVVRTTEVMRLLGVSRVTLWAWRRKGLFPVPRRFGPNTIGWSVDEIRAWMESRPNA